MEEPEYIVEDAAEFVSEQISETLKAKLSFEDIVEILEIEFEFMKASGLITHSEPIVNLPIEVDEAAMRYYIIHNCAKADIILSEDELDEILDAETAYMDSIGLIDEEGMAPFYN